jgi:uncharacterized membrane protein
MLRWREHRKALAGLIFVAVALTAIACEDDLDAVGSVSAGYGINNLGLVAGETTPPKTYLPIAATFSAESNTPVPFTTDNRDHSRGTDINDAGVVVGFDARVMVSPTTTARGSHTGRLAMAWAPGEPPQVLETLDPRPTPVKVLGSEAAAVNNAGIVVGHVLTDSGATHAARWDLKSRTFTDLEGAGGSRQSRALGVNEAGQIVGWSSQGAFLWDPARPGLQVFGGIDAGATAINDTGDIVGWVTKTRPEDGPGSRRMARWGTTDLAVTEIAGFGAAEAQLNGVNDAHQAVGASRRPGGSETHAVRVKLADGSVSDLGSEGKQSSARAINAAGYVAGDAQAGDGNIHATRWTP